MTNQQQEVASLLETARDALEKLEKIAEGTEGEAFGARFRSVDSNLWNQLSDATWTASSLLADVQAS